MDIDWTLINQAKNLVEQQIPEPILKIKIVPDYREPLIKVFASSYAGSRYRS